MEVRKGTGVRFLVLGVVPEPPGCVRPGLDEEVGTQDDTRDHSRHETGVTGRDTGQLRNGGEDGV